MRGSVLTAMARSVHWLVEALVKRLKAIVPSEFVIEPSANGSGIHIRRRGSLPLGLVQYVEEIVEQDAAIEKNSETAVRSALDGIQDYISEYTTEPWPTKRDAPRQLFRPEVVVADGLIRAWFGDKTDPALVLDVIPLPPR